MNPYEPTRIEQVSSNSLRSHAYRLFVANYLFWGSIVVIVKLIDLCYRYSNDLSLRWGFFN